MKNTIIYSLILCTGAFFNLCFAQAPNTIKPNESSDPPPVIELGHKSDTSKQAKSKSNQIFMYVQQMPEFPGGSSALMNYLSTNIKYPPKAVENNVEGTVLLQFVVNTDGSISDVKVLRDVSAGCTEEAVRVVKAIPNWKPGKQNGSNVSVYFHLPVTFKLNDDKPKKSK